MGIEFFRKGGKGYAPKASLRKQGQIGLNHGAVEKFDIKDGQYILLGYDREKGMVAIRRIDATEEGAKKVIVKARSGSIAAKGFLDYFGITPKETKAYPLQEEPDKKLLIFFIKEKENSEND